MNSNNAGMIVFIGVALVGVFLLVGGQVTYINSKSSSQVVQLYNELALLAPKKGDTCSSPSEEVTCVTAGNVIVYQQTGKISVYDAVSKGNIATFVLKDKSVHFSATSNALNLLALEFIDRKNAK